MPGRDAINRVSDSSGRWSFLITFPVDHLPKGKEGLNIVLFLNLFDKANKFMGTITE